MPDGKLYVHTGVGNLGTYSYAATSRVAAEVLGYKWDNVVIVRGRSDNHLPWMIGQFGSNTTSPPHAATTLRRSMPRTSSSRSPSTSWAAPPTDYDLKDERVVHKSDASKSISFAEAAKKAIELGGKYSGKEVPNDINPLTKASATALAGSGLIGVAKDKLPKRGLTPALVAGFCMIELDRETGKFKILDILASPTAAPCCIRKVCRPRCSAAA